MLVEIRLTNNWFINKQTLQVGNNLQRHERYKSVCNPDKLQSAVVVSTRLGPARMRHGHGAIDNSLPLLIYQTGL